MQPAFDLVNTFVHLNDDGVATPIEVDETFWQELMGGGGERRLNDGRLVMNFEFTDNWEQWEMHPAGDELVYLVSGSVDLILEGNGGESVIELRKGNAACLVPRGVWHTARVHQPSEVLHITPGAGTQHRPV